VTSSLPRRAATIACVCLAAIVASCSRTPPSARDPELAANAFFAALAKGDARAAYDSAAFGFQAAQTFDAFLSNARELGLVGGQLPAWTGKEVHDNEAHLDGTLINLSGTPVTLSITMTPDGQAWKLFSLKTATGLNEAENHFTLVGKGTGFNDVYHQPIPAPRLLDDLVRATMVSFSDAIRKKDFHAFYLGISQEWKDGARASGDQASGVTENMLKTHFQGFIDKKIDLSAVAGLQPVYDQPPQINEEGLLEVQGHFDTQPYRLIFTLQYIYELPRWKLFGIDLGLTR
jgi:hypothetical protein